MEPAELVDRFLEHHSVADPAERAAILADAITDNAEFHGLQINLVGRDQIQAGPIGTSHLVRTSPVQQRGRWLRWEWEYRKPDGRTEMADDETPYGGAAVAMLADDGRLQLIVPFLGQRP